MKIILASDYLLSIASAVWWCEYILTVLLVLRHLTVFSPSRARINSAECWNLFSKILPSQSSAVTKYSFQFTAPLNSVFIWMLNAYWRKLNLRFLHQPYSCQTYSFTVLHDQRSTLPYCARHNFPYTRGWMQMVFYYQMIYSPETNNTIKHDSCYCCWCGN